MNSVTAVVASAAALWILLSPRTRGYRTSALVTALGLVLLATFFLAKIPIALAGGPVEDPYAQTTVNVLAQVVRLVAILMITVGFVLMCNERLTLELLASRDRVNQAERAEMVGRLAGGVAHNFNNRCGRMGSRAGPLQRRGLRGGRRGVHDGRGRARRGHHVHGVPAARGARTHPVRRVPRVCHDLVRGGSYAGLRRWRSPSVRREKQAPSAPSPGRRRTSDRWAARPHERTVGAHPIRATGPEEKAHEATPSPEPSPSVDPSSIDGDVRLIVMAIDAEAGCTASRTGVPYAPSWVDRVIASVHRLPVPAWATYLVATLAAVAAAVTATWATSGGPGPGPLMSAVWGVLVVAAFWVIDLLGVRSNHSLDDFSPVLAETPVEIERMRYALMVSPARPVLIVTLGAAALASVDLALDVALFHDARAGSGVPALIVSELVNVVALTMLAVFLFRVVHRLRTIARIHDRVVRLDIFRPWPLYAFSHVTGPTAAILVALMVVLLVAFPPPAGSGTLGAVWLLPLVALPILGAVDFAAPLWSLHRRLAAEKARLRDGSQARIHAVLAEIDADAASNDHPHAPALGATLANLIQERSVIERLSTWPWSATMVRGLGTAILLPTLLFLCQRLLFIYV